MLKVFISSTSIDLPDYRAAVRDAILALDMFPVGMETWPVSGRDSVELCREKVYQCDIYLGIYAYRYGWRPDGDGGKSITEMEYDWAGEVVQDGHPMPRLCFIMQEAHPWPSDKDHRDQQPDDIAALNAFKQQVTKVHAGFYTTPADLKAQVTAALSKIQREREADSLKPFKAQPGATLPKCILDELIDEGGNGHVWRAREVLADGRYHRVAVKLLKPAVSADTERVERFKKEISAARQLNHPHILRTLEYGMHRGQFYMVMDFIEGKTLRHKLTGKPLPTELVIQWLGQIASALEAAHAAGFIHRDIKPENILCGRVGGQDHLYLTDFGLVYSSDADERLTEHGDLIGTGRYMSPEQCNPDHAMVTARSDIYALGIVAYELLTGQTPFTGPNRVVLCQKHLSEPLPTHPALPESLHRIVAKATAKQPDDRYASAAAFMADLRRWQEDPANLEPVIMAYVQAVEKRLRETVLERFVELAGDELGLRQRIGEQLSRPTLDDFDPFADAADYDPFFQKLSAPVEADHIRIGQTERTHVPKVRERLMTLERVVLVGEPGAGKTWMLMRLALAYAAAYRQNPSGGLIPVFVPLNAYREKVPFAEFVRGRMGGLAAHLDRLVREGRVVLLCDALNEMPNAQLEKVRAYLKTVKHFVISCRVRDYRSDDLNALKPLEQVVLRDMDVDALHEFVRRRLGEALGGDLWTKMGGSEDLLHFWQKVKDKGEPERFWDAKAGIPSYTVVDEDRAWRTMHNTAARLIPLSRNPFTAQMVCGLYERERALPSNRAALFGLFVASLIERERKNAERVGVAFPPTEDIESALVSVARALQARTRTVLTLREAVEAVNRPDAETVLKAALDANLLVMDGDESVKFAHQLLQEYFAVRILLEAFTIWEADPTQPTAAAFFDPWWKAGVWRETTVILVELLGEGAVGANRAARWLAGMTPEIALNVILRNGAGLTVNDVADETRRALIDGAQRKTSESDPIGRAAVYRVLGLLEADTRFGIGLGADGLPEFDWVDIPAGEFLCGDERESDNPPRKLTLPTFKISKYPVTYRQFQAFIDAPDGFHDPRWWDGLKASDDHKSVPGDQRFKFWNHPPEAVSWYDAIAFCRWLSYKRGGKWGLDEVDQWPVRLPTEFEWERAARGTDGREYPYEGGFDAAKGNTRETGIGQTSAVGMFPEGASPDGVLDMSGNVWEWCLTDYSNPAPDAAGEDLRTDARRVLRGGSWPRPQDDARAAYRNLSHPNDRDLNDGFRLVLRP